MSIITHISSSFVHDAMVSIIELHINDRGDRELRIQLRCDNECGCDEWNGKIVEIKLLDPVVIVAELFGHMANGESIDSWSQVASEGMKERVRRLTNAGLPAPNQMVEIVFHSGSVMEVACSQIQFFIAQS